MTNTVVRDINYAKTKRQESRILSLEDQLRKPDTKSKNLTRDDGMEIVEVSGTFLLGVIPDKLDLPLPRYQARTHRRGQFVTDITFYPLKEHMRHPPTLVRLSSSPLHNLQTTIDVVFPKAIHYMEDHQKKVLQDYNYTELKRSEETNLHLADLVTEKDESIKGLTTTIGNYISTVFTTCDQISQLDMSDSVVARSTSSSEVNRKNSEIQHAVARLSKVSHEVVRFLSIAFAYAEEDNNGGSDGTSMTFNIEKADC